MKEGVAGWLWEAVRGGAEVPGRLWEAAPVECKETERFGKAAPGRKGEQELCVESSVIPVPGRLRPF